MSFETLISCAQLSAVGNTGDCRVFDCRFDLADTRRGEQAYRRGHIPGAFYAHLDRQLSSPITPQSGRHPLPDVDALRRWLGGHGVGPAVQVVVYDDSGGTMAVRLWWLLRWLGHPRVAVLDGGWPSWVRAGLPQQREQPAQPEAVLFDGQPAWDQVVSTTQIAQQLRSGDSGVQLMDARTPERFRGEAEPIDPVAGHIPGAINLPLQLNLAADGRFQPVDTLKALYNEALGEHRADEIALMCGSGVTACHNLLAMEIAGLHGARLYAGSWSEWIRDPARPVATGGGGD